MRFKHLHRWVIDSFNWESWHYHIKYIPIAPVWLWYCFKARSFWFFTASNPGITFGGFEGEGKKEIYDQLPDESYPASVYIGRNDSFDEIKSKITLKNIRYPLVVKPDIGAMGYLFRRITNEAQLKKYNSFMDMEYIIQEWVQYPMELSIFYYRMPDSDKGVITGMLMKEMPAVKGDGVSTLSELIENNEVLRLNYENICARHKDKMQKVIPAGKRFVLSHASNRSQGGRLVNLNHEIDERICGVFDKVSCYSHSFYYGRYDVKCESLESLRQGKNFTILEYNGSGAGIQHIYGNHLSLWMACYTIVRHWEKLYQISRYNKEVRNISYWRFSDGRKFLKNAMANLKRLKTMDETFPVSS